MGSCSSVGGWFCGREFLFWVGAGVGSGLVVDSLQKCARPARAMLDGEEIVITKVILSDKA